MRICLILEGSYPYVHGGVSTWMHQYIQNMPQHEFVLWVIGAKAKDRGKFVYQMLDNVVEVHEVFLDDALHLAPSKRLFDYRFSKEELESLRQLMETGRPNWELLCQLYQDKQLNPVDFLQSESFLEMMVDLCQEQYAYNAFAEVFHTIRSMLLPVFYLLGQEVPQADVYHAISTGYSGILALLGQYRYGRPILLTEHGIYTREREEEIIRSNWVLPSMKNHWIKFFYMLSDIIYSRAQIISSLFTKARLTQIEIGCNPERCRVIENGIDFQRFSSVPAKIPDGQVDIGAVVRLAPIKDIKTMLYAFYELSNRLDNVRLHIMGGVDDEEYAQECYDLVKQMQLDNVIFTGRVDIVTYMENLDFTILTSISEAQPLSVLESLASGRPCVTTDVGCCRELLEGGPDDYLGLAGYCVPPTYQKGLADAMELMCRSQESRLKMGAIGRARVERYYQYNRMLKGYLAMYEEVEA